MRRFLTAECLRVDFCRDVVQVPRCRRHYKKSHLTTAPCGGGGGGGYWDEGHGMTLGQEGFTSHLTSQCYQVNPLQYYT